MPLNFRYTSEEIRYCLELSEASVLVFGPEFTDRVQPVYGDLKNIRFSLFVGWDVPDFAESYDPLINCCSTCAAVGLHEEDDAAIDACVPEQFRQANKAVFLAGRICNI